MFWLVGDPLQNKPRHDVMKALWSLDQIQLVFENKCYPFNRIAVVFPQSNALLLFLSENNISTEMMNECDPKCVYISAYMLVCMFTRRLQFPAK